MYGRCGAGPSGRTLGFSAGRRGPRRSSHRPRSTPLRLASLRRSPARGCTTPPTCRKFQQLRQSLETGWLELLRARVGLSRAQLPLLWDCDFLFGERAAGDAERHVLCEINVSSVSPFPPSAIDPLVAAVQRRLQRAAQVPS
jgi:hypothetical protein